MICLLKKIYIIFVLYALVRYLWPTLYNNGMREVDVMDQLLGSYRQSTRGKKWYWPLVVNGLNVSVVAAWCLHCALGAKPMSHFAF